MAKGQMRSNKEKKKPKADKKPVAAPTATPFGKGGAAQATTAGKKKR